MKAQSIATTKHNFQRLVFNPVNQKLTNFNDELQTLANDVVRGAAQAIIEQIIFAKMSPDLKKSNNRLHLENGTFEQVVSHLETDLELIGLEAPDGLRRNPVTQQATQQNPEKPKSTCHLCRKPNDYPNQCRQLKREK